MIRIEQHGAVAQLWIDRGAARNAFDLAGWRAMRDAAAAIPVESRAVIVTSADPGSFSAGADIHEIAARRLTPDWSRGFLTEMRAAIDGVAALPMPVIAAIDGGCFGAAVALILAADIRIAGEVSRFAVTPAKLGLLYPADDVARLIEAVGRGQTSRLLFSADSIDAAEALRIGLVEQIAPEANKAAMALANRIAANPPGAVAGLKALVRDPRDSDHEGLFLDALAGDELGVGLKRFLDRKTA